MFAPARVMEIENNSATKDVKLDKQATAKIRKYMFPYNAITDVRREQRTNKLIHGDLDAENHMLEAAMEHSKQFNNNVNRKYSIWRKEYDNPSSDSTLKLMRDQIIMARVHQNIAQSRSDNSLIDSLKKHIKECRDAIGEANSDVELQPRALEQAKKKKGHALSAAKGTLYECSVAARKFRAMLQPTEERVNILKNQSSFLIQLAAKMIPKPLHCLTQQLTANYLLEDYASEEDQDDDKTEDPSLYHYAIFSDNVLATSVVVNSTANYAKEPEKHIFDIVSDKLNVAAMKMWFHVNAPPNLTIEIKTIDDFKWLSSSYCPVLRQLESRDLTPHWSVDPQGMVNGAVETCCKESFHRFDKYLNFSNPLISENFDANAFGWAFGMNMFDLKEWKKQNITGIYHVAGQGIMDAMENSPSWIWTNNLLEFQTALMDGHVTREFQTAPTRYGGGHLKLNEERTLWKLGSLPPGLTTFYNLTYPLERTLHVLGLGYDSALNQTEIDNAAVIHYNGNYKQWLELASPKYRGYWSKFLKLDNLYLGRCSIDIS
ncbi:hypothetical protein ACLOJK_002412 [Asimina triloba]